jgi:predicted ArsR family transcriptional regulator
MPKIKRDAKKRIWRSLLSHLAKKNPPKTTAIDLADDVEMDYHCILQVLRRLRDWGYVKLVGFEPAEGDRGRQRHVFEVTPRGQRAAEYSPKRKRNRR